MKVAEARFYLRNRRPGGLGGDTSILYIPKEVRNILKLKNGDIVEFSEEGYRIYLSRVPQ